MIIKKWSAHIILTTLLIQHMCSCSMSVPTHGNFCGPNHPLIEATSTEDEIEKLRSIQPIDDIDNACKWHDICYAAVGYFDKDCDDLMAGALIYYEKRLINNSDSHYCENFIDAVMTHSKYSHSKIVNLGENASDSAESVNSLPYDTVKFAYGAILTPFYSLDNFGNKYILQKDFRCFSRNKISDDDFVSEILTIKNQKLK